MIDSILCIMVLVLSSIISYFIARKMPEDREDRIFLWMVLTFLISMALITVITGSVDYRYNIEKSLEKQILNLLW